MTLKRQETMPETLNLFDTHINGKTQHASLATDLAEGIVEALDCLPLEQKIHELNRVREILHRASPFKSEPVDFVRWVPFDAVSANDYNPNSVAPPEMELLHTSIAADGYTQPIVGNEEGSGFVVVDGFHRHRVGKEYEDISERVCGYLPVVQIRAEQVGRNDRIASTIRHNRARGKHRVEAMSDIVVELKNRNWSNSRIAKELGMDQDEILRLCQITGLTELFSNQQFSEAWEAEGHISPDDFEDLSGKAEDYEDIDVEARTVNTSDEERVFHTYDKWECHKAGFYNTKPPDGMTKDECIEAYRGFLADLDTFEEGLKLVIAEWKHSCEHYLTNKAMNRIAWLGQAAMCRMTGVSSEFRGGFSMLTEEQQQAANELALVYLNKWLTDNGLDALSMDEASPSRQSDIY